MPIDPEKVKTHLAASTHEYLRTRQPELMARLSSGLEYLLTWHWEQSGRPEPYWFDGLVHATPRIRKTQRLEIEGLMIWAKDAGPQWIDLFSADLKVSKAGETLEDYVLRFGRTESLDRRIPYGDERALLKELQHLDQGTWAYVFNKS